MKGKKYQTLHVWIGFLTPEGLAADKTRGDMARAPTQQGCRFSRGDRANEQKSLQDLQ